MRILILATVFLAVIGAPFIYHMSKAEFYSERSYAVFSEMYLTLHLTEDAGEEIVITTLPSEKEMDNPRSMNRYLDDRVRKAALRRYLSLEREWGIVFSKIEDDTLIYEYIPVPRYFTTDFASIPVWARFVTPVFGRHAEAAVLHDYLYTTAGQSGISRVDADRMFYEFMIRSGKSKWQARLMYAAVRIGGSFPHAPLYTWAYSFTPRLTEYNFPLLDDCRPSITSANIIRKTWDTKSEAYELHLQNDQYYDRITFETHFEGIRSGVKTYYDDSWQAAISSEHCDRQDLLDLITLTPKFKDWRATHPSRPESGAEMVSYLQFFSETYGDLLARTLLEHIIENPDEYFWYSDFQDEQKLHERDDENMDERASLLDMVSQEPTAHESDTGLSSSRDN